MSLVVRHVPTSVQKVAEVLLVIGGATVRNPGGAR
jgi:hypothetical protein